MATTKKTKKQKKYLVTVKKKKKKKTGDQEHFLLSVYSAQNHTKGYKERFSLRQSKIA